jgi:ribonuclease P protein component
MQSFRFYKSEKLCSSILIAKLFEKGNRSLNRFPFRFTWLYEQHPGDYPVQVLFIVSKRNFQAAHDRNAIKRQMREMYRLNKHELYEKLGHKKVILQIAYAGKSRMATAELQPIFLQAFDELKKYA